MRAHVAATGVLTLSCAFLGAACLQSATEIPGTDEVRPWAAGASDPEPIGEAAQAAYEDTFHFVVVVKDDGEGDGGGWQVATATLSFVVADDHRLLPYFFKCPIEIGMAIRSAEQGLISPGYAARVSAEVATEITESLMHGRDWRSQGVVYCKELRERMERRFWKPPYDLLKS
jgi:hypothetical protein